MVLSRQDIGHRVVVRRVIGERDGRPLLSDALGHLEELTDAAVTVRTAKGTVRIPLSQVYRAKRVPDQRPVTRREIIALELAADAGWPAPVTRALGQWRLRGAQGWTGRANSALPIGDPGMPTGEAIDAVVRWYADQGQQPLINVPLPYGAGLDAALAALGWAHRPPVLVCATDVGRLASTAPVNPELPPVRLEQAPSPAWLDTVTGRKGGLPDAARHVLTAVDQVRFAEVRGAADEVLAIARGAVTSGWLGISVLEVTPSARRRGLARQVIGALARWSAEAGATRAYLQVEEHNVPATTLYAGLGFTTHHRYHTRYAP